MQLIDNPREMQTLAKRIIASGKTIGFVPTMGYLHEGHLSLVREAVAAECDTVVTSIFVNPTQFGPGEDFESYPRDTERDLSLLESAGNHIVFFPTPANMYPGGYRTYITVEGLSDRLCGLSRPGHFRGVATVVLKLCNIVSPHKMFMGEKDFQQAVVLQRMLVDLNMDVELVRCPTVREPDGLAMSSRNTYLSSGERVRALCLHQAILNARHSYAGGTRDSATLLGLMRNIIETAGGVVDYIQIVDPQTLDSADIVGDDSRIILAVKIGKTRLIDNAPIGM